jgi:hypothetical protein
VACFFQRFDSVVVAFIRRSNERKNEACEPPAVHPDGSPGAAAAGLHYRQPFGRLVIETTSLCTRFAVIQTWFRRFAEGQKLEGLSPG